jgi:hypothetical protein
LARLGARLWALLGARLGARLRSWLRRRVVERLRAFAEPGVVEKVLARGVVVAALVEAVALADIVCDVAVILGVDIACE